MARRAHEPTWHLDPNAAESFARFCAPVALAALTGAAPLEAAQMLLAAPEVLHPHFGGVRADTWHQWLRRELDGIAVDVAHPDGHQRWREAQAREDGRWDAGYEYSRPRIRGASWAAAHRYTTAQFLTTHPQGAYVLSVNGHTFLVRDGRVAADSLSQSMMRARVRTATFFPGA